MLVGWGVMARPYAAALALLADAVADWVEAGEDLATAPPDEVAQLRRHKSDAWKRAMAAFREFGMTPAAVTAIKKVEKPEKSALDRFKIA